MRLRPYQVLAPVLLTAALATGCASTQVYFLTDEREFKRQEIELRSYMEMQKDRPKEERDPYGLTICSIRF